MSLLLVKRFTVTDVSGLQWETARESARRQSKSLPGVTESARVLPEAGPS